MTPSKHTSLTPQSWQMNEPDVRFGRKIIWLSLLGLFAFVVWAANSEIDQITRAPAQVIARSRTQIIQSSDGGVIEEMLVREGDEVKRGQVLVRIDRTKAQAAFLEARARAAGVSAAVSRLRAEVFNTKLQFEPLVADYPQFRANQLSLLARRQSAINEELDALLQQHRLVERELAMNEPLIKTGDVSMAEVLKLQRQLSEIFAQITNRRNRYFQDAQAELSKAEEELASLEQSAAQRKDLLDRTELSAPVRGIVKNVRFTTIGAVLRAGEEVLQIVPGGDDLVVEAKVKPSDIAFLKPGLGAMVKIDAYDFSIYGGLDGTVTYISADTLSEDLKQGEQAYYRVQVKTTGRQFSRRSNEQLDIQPGMTATVEIRTGMNTVLRYLVKPLIKTVDEALTER